MAGAEYVVWVASAGPNGIIDTPYKRAVAAAVLGSDDVGVRGRYALKRDPGPRVECVTL